MKKKTKATTNQFDELKRIGYEFKAPQDEFSYQPDSGSTANGSIGKQEYGIDIDPDAQNLLSIESEKTEDREDPSGLILGESNWSQEHRLPADEIKGAADNKIIKISEKINNAARRKANQIIPEVK